ncbi:hypothetical protein [Microcystis sp. M122S2]|jgi:hypothetical protein|uniref:hypothetical protein n=1 Tax=Microcystis sp. M122S2 TaxID=2771142 RepID=UPI002588A0A0|nr:hypothetical protein [Microcystis sp. M122S2]
MLTNSPLFDAYNHPWIERDDTSSVDGNDATRVIMSILLAVDVDYTNSFKAR